jgi:hypothetical protein
LSDTASQQIARKIVVEQMKAKGIKINYVPDWADKPGKLGLGCWRIGLR